MDPAPQIPRRRRMGMGVVILTILGIGALALLVALAMATSRTPPMSPPTTATYNLHESMELSFPDCAVVSVSWHEVPDHQVGFGAGQSAEVVLVSDFHGPPNSLNDSCPPEVCPPGVANAGPGPMEYETATHGSFQFTATQPSYSFWAHIPNSTTLSSDPIQINVSYTTPLVPATWAVPLLGGFIFVVAAAIVTVSILAVRHLRTHDRPH